MDDHEHDHICHRPCLGLSSSFPGIGSQLSVIAEEIYKTDLMAVIGKGVWEIIELKDENDVALPASFYHHLCEVFNNSLGSPLNICDLNFQPFKHILS